MSFISLTEFSKTQENKFASNIQSFKNILKISSVWFVILLMLVLVIPRSATGVRMSLSTGATFLGIAALSAAYLLYVPRKLPKTLYFQEN